MAIVTVIEASRLVRRSPQTLYRHISQGRVSAVLNHTGEKCIDTSELQRAYGLLHSQGDTQPQVSFLSAENQNKSGLEQDFIDSLKQELADCKEEKRRLLTLLEQRFITHMSEAKPDKKNKKKKK